MLDENFYIKLNLKFPLVSGLSGIIFPLLDRRKCIVFSFFQVPCVSMFMYHFIMGVTGSPKVVLNKNPTILSLLLTYIIIYCHILYYHYHININIVISLLYYHCFAVCIISSIIFLMLQLTVIIYFNLVS